MGLYKTLLEKFLSFQSISTDPNYKQEVHACAQWLSGLLQKNNFNSKLIEGYGNPVIFAEHIINSKYKTALIYGHYDVQPAEKKDGWVNSPFKLAEKNNKYIARGVADNKGQVLIHLYSVFELIKKNQLKYNIKFIIEGDEESGSERIQDLIFDHKKLLKCDFVLFSDGELSFGSPTIDIGFRGIFNCTITAKTSKKDNHSGLYGGSIPNSAFELLHLINGMYSKEKILTLPGVDNQIETLPEIYKKQNVVIPFNKEEFLSNTGAKKRLNDDKIDFYSQTGLLSSAEITTLVSGYLGEGYKNAIPGTSKAKINFRIATRHKTSEVIKKFLAYVKNSASEICEFKVEIDQSSEPIFLSVDSELGNKISSQLKKIYKKDAIKKFCGAIVPISGIFQNTLTAEVFSIGLANEDCNMHGVNENFDIGLIKMGINFSKTFFSNG